ncbi:MAG: hypothetical protein Q9O62_03420 [Ardenticatenia bacterium]|nr:hypothetical protein [Ardenticatenia bacterium]
MISPQVHIVVVHTEAVMVSHAVDLATHIMSTAEIVVALCPPVGRR